MDVQITRPFGRIGLGRLDDAGQHGPALGSVHKMTAPSSLVVREKIVQSDGSVLLVHDDEGLVVAQALVHTSREGSADGERVVDLKIYENTRLCIRWPMKAIAFLIAKRSADGFLSQKIHQKKNKNTDKITNSCQKLKYETLQICSCSDLMLRVL